MSTAVVTAQGLTKQYGQGYALSNVDFSIKSGQIVGLIGPNGAGKTTALKAILGLIPYEGQLDVLGLNPHKQRTQLLDEVCFIADTAILPRWMKVSQTLDYVEGVHKKFNREKALGFLRKTNIKMKSKIGELSKGMVTQLHLALVMAIDAKLLVLDEPTLGLDIIHRKDFYATLLSEYFDHDKTIIVTTHQVEEIENILTDVMFIQDGKIVLNENMEAISEKYIEVEVNEAELALAKEKQPLSIRPTLGGASLIFDRNQTEFDVLGKTKILSIADLFVALMRNEKIANGGV